MSSTRKWCAFAGGIGIVLNLFAASETIGDYTWTYQVTKGKATLVSDKVTLQHIYGAAISPSPVGSLTVPETLGGFIVREFGTGAFFQCRQLEHISIPSSVELIGNGSFQECNKLAEIDIPEGVSLIDDFAFYECRKLAEVQLPSTLKTIGICSFSWTTNLTSITLPAGLSSIESTAFSGSGIESIDIPESVTTIQYDTFKWCHRLNSVRARGSISYIGKDAFLGCEELTTVEMNAKSADSSAFSGCTKLSAIIVDGSICVADIFSTVAHQITNIVVSADSTAICDGAFEYCVGLKSVLVPDSVLSIGENAFDTCGNSYSVTFQGPPPTGIEYAGINQDAVILYNYAFESEWLPVIAQCGWTNATPYNPPKPEGGPYTETVDGIAWTFMVANGEASVGTGKYKTPAIPESTKGDLAIPSVLGGRPVTSIGESAFYNCYGLTSVEIPSSVTNIGRSAFCYCSSLTSVKIPSSVTRIENDAFYNCYGLTSVEIPSSVTSIGGSAFYNCYGLTSVKIPSSVTNIEAIAFYGCYGLTSVEIPPSVTRIGARAFSGCSGLMSVKLHSGTGFGSQVFVNCNLRRVSFDGSAPQNLGALGLNATTKICYPKEYEESWKALLGDMGEESGFISIDPSSPSGGGTSYTGTISVTNVVIHYVVNSIQSSMAAPVTTDTKFVNVITEIKGGNVAIPDTWAANYPTFKEKFGSDFTTALTKTTGKVDSAGNPMFVWQDYVAGTDPTDVEDVFTASVTMVEGKPVVSYTPELSEAEAAKRVYTKYGKVQLQDEEWVKIPEGEEGKYNFFKVTVRMK